MKSVLIILSKSNVTSLQVHESLSATLVLATFGCAVKVLFKDAALSLLNENLKFDAQNYVFKIASNLVESFEFYDLSPIYVEQKNQMHPLVKGSTQEIEFVDLNAEFIQQFDHVIYW